VKRILSIFLLIAVLLVVIGLSALFFYKFEGSPPKILRLSMPERLGRHAKISLTVADERSGIREVLLVLTQKGRQEVIFHEVFPVDRLRGSAVREKSFEISFEPLKMGFRSGEALLLIQVTDGSWRNGLKGNSLVAKKKVILDLEPARIVVLSNLHYLVPGGSNLVVYRLSEPVRYHGVRIDDLFFRGYELPSYPGACFALIALPIEKKSVSNMIIEAVDQAGNKSNLPIPYYLKRKHYRRDVIHISDGFLKRKIPEFLDRYPEIPHTNLLKAFIYINSVLRTKNNEQISKICRQSRVDDFYATKALLRLPRSATRSLFGDHRTYYYGKEKIGEATHLGIDLASVSGAPVPAAAEGQVVFADYLGIYGNTIILDHGLGLFTLYAHLAGFTVSEGDHVKRGQLIAYTDTTGLAGGDHLHFGTIVQGIFVDPIEWFDPQWVRTRITEKLEMVKASQKGSAGL